MSSDRIILNKAAGGSSTASSSPSSATDLMNRLNKLMTTMKSDHIQSDAGIDYASLRMSAAYADYLVLSRQLDGCDVLALGVSERKAFFINLYNAMTIHVLATQDELPAVPKDLPGMWNRYSYRVAGHVFNLDEIEHGLLRANTGPPRSPETPLLPAGDPRRQFVIEALDCRVHFALNCGARSCPPIRVYEADKLDAQLDRAAASFCSQEVVLLPDKETVEMSTLMLWYNGDFGKSETEILKRVGGFLPEGSEARAAIAERAEKLKLAFRPYDWSIFAKK